MDEGPPLEPGRFSDAVNGALPQPDFRRCLPVPGSSGTLPILGPPTPVVDEAIGEIREPPADVLPTPGWIHVTLEIPGAVRDSIDVAAVGDRVTVLARTQDGRAYRQEIGLPVPVDPSSLRATNRNDVLDLTMRRTRPESARGESSGR